MTRAGFGALSSAISQAQAAIRQKHCPPPTFYPLTEVVASMTCMRCGGRLSYAVLPISARTSGQCSSAGCIKWMDLP